MRNRPNNQFDVLYHRYGRSTMEINGCHCDLHMPDALVSKFDNEGNEIDQSLPPYRPRHAFKVDDFDAACPATWMRGSPTEASYFVPVQEEHGLWLDFRANTHHTHHVATVVSTQGINAVTSMPTEGAFHLEQYQNKCPKHDVPFGADRFCKQCKFKWPHQNYLATTTGAVLWLDGFRAKDGVVRQFKFTDKEMCGIAAQLIGEKRVFAIGVAFYLSKEPKPLQRPTVYRGGGIIAKGAFGYNNSGILGATVHEPPETFDLTGQLPVLEEQSLFAPVLRGGAACRRTIPLSATMPTSIPARAVMPAGVPSNRAVVHRAPVAPVQLRKKLEIGAGARINQGVGHDVNDIGFWQENPVGILYINYADEATVSEILAKGKEDRTAHGEGPLAGLVVGNYPGVGNNH